eukprot:363901-Chlamydomonas_euryale.AAC.24
MRGLCEARRSAQASQSCTREIGLGTGVQVPAAESSRDMSPHTCQAGVVATGSLPAAPSGSPNMETPIMIR